MNDKVTHGLNHLNWLTQTQGGRLLRCRRAGRPCAFRFQPAPGTKGKKSTDVPFLCGFIAAGTECTGENLK